MSRSSIYPPDAARIPIKGFLEVSALDYPAGAPGAVLFLGGCNIRCRYCQAAHLVSNMTSLTSIALEDVMLALIELKGFVQGVTVTGGEPTVHPGLEALLCLLKDEGFRVKLDTWGNAPERTTRWVERGLVDALAVDVKGPLERYQELVQRGFSAERFESLRKWFTWLSREAPLPVEFRMTVHRSLINEEGILQTARQIRGAQLFVLQPYKVVPGFDSSLMQKDSYSDHELYAIAQRIEATGVVDRCCVRGYETMENSQSCAS